MNDAVQIAFEDLSQSVRVDSQLENDSVTSKISNVLLKTILVVIGVGTGGFIGLSIALFTGLIEFRC